MVNARNYYGVILRAFEPHLGPHVVEVGAGIGTFSAFLLEARPQSTFTLVEPADNNFIRLAARFQSDPRVKPVHGYLEQLELDKAADAVVAINVMEHVEHDVEFLRAAHRTLSRTGTLLLYVPSHPAIFGTLDEAFEHYRRYTRASLDARLEAAGFAHRSLRYVNAPGVLSWFLAGRIFRRRTLSARDVSLYDRWVTPWVDRVEQHWRPPFGQSLLAIATK